MIRKFKRTDNDLSNATEQYFARVHSPRRKRVDSFGTINSLQQRIQVFDKSRQSNQSNQSKKSKEKTHKEAFNAQYYYTVGYQGRTNHPKPENSEVKQLFQQGMGS